MREVLAEEKLEALPLQIRKVMQFHEACQQRMGVVVVGPSGCGKSTIWKLLHKANAKLGRKIPTYVMNPKAMPREISPHISLYLHASPRISLHLPTSPCISPYLPASPHISLCISEGDAARAAARPHGHGHTRVVRRRADRLRAQGGSSLTQP